MFNNIICLLPWASMYQFWFCSVKGYFVLWATVSPFLKVYGDLTLLNAPHYLNKGQ